MKRNIFVVLLLACLIFEQASSKPEKTLQEKAHDLVDRFKASAQETVEHAQEAASRAADAAKSAAHDAMEAGREWVAANFPNQTVIERIDKEMD